MQKELERERINTIRMQQKFEQDFDFHKQMVVNDCGRHIEELQEEHRESIRNIERKLSTDQRQDHGSSFFVIKSCYLQPIVKNVGVITEILVIKEPFQERFRLRRIQKIAS